MSIDGASITLIALTEPGKETLSRQLTASITAVVSGDGTDDDRPGTHEEASGHWRKTDFAGKESRQEGSLAIPPALRTVERGPMRIAGSRRGASSTP